MRDTEHNMWIISESGEVYYITEMRFFIEYNVTVKLPKEIKISDFKKHEEIAQASLLNINFSDDKSTLNIVKNANTGQVDAFFIDSNGGWEKSEGGLTFDTQTGEITRSEE